MKAKEYIIEHLNDFVSSFKKARVRYEYDELSAVHTIEVLPNEFYHHDQDYIQWENDFYHDFIKKFPIETICFVSDDAIVGIEKSDFVAEGLEFAPLSEIKSEPKTSVNNHFDIHKVGYKNFAAPF